MPFCLVYSEAVYIPHKTFVNVTIILDVSMGHIQPPRGGGGGGDGGMGGWGMGGGDGGDGGWGGGDMTLTLTQVKYDLKSQIFRFYPSGST